MLADIGNRRMLMAFDASCACGACKIGITPAMVGVT
jgi:hypothetical protein